VPQQLSSVVVEDVLHQRVLLDAVAGEDLVVTVADKDIGAVEPLEHGACGGVHQGVVVQAVEEGAGGGVPVGGRLGRPLHQAAAVGGDPAVALARGQAGQQGRADEGLPLLAAVVLGDLDAEQELEQGVPPRQRAR